MSNYDARQLASNPGNISGIIGDVIRSGGEKNFFKAVVFDYLIEPSLESNLTTRIFDEQNIKNFEYAKIAPRNSIVAQIIDSAAAKKENSLVVCYPFLPPYLCMPCNPGETVWLFSDGSGGTSPLYYWMWRVTEPDFVDDINYTHSDRRYIGNQLASTSERANRNSNSNNQQDELRYSFPNGAGTEDSTTIQGGQLAFDEIVNTSFSYLHTINEAVPRYSKRPGEFVIQGCNNSLVSLGYLRQSPNGLKTSAISSSQEKSGVIDIVVGRGVSETTSPPTKINTRGLEEVDKSSKEKLKPCEGDPDWVNDLSRLTLFMNCEGDQLFNIEPHSTTSEINGPFAILNSENIRINSNSGTIRINNGSTKVQIESDGTIILEADKIIFDSDSIDLGLGASESLIQGDKFINALDQFLTLMDAAAVGPLAPFKAPIAAFKPQLESFKSSNVKIK